MGCLHVVCVGEKESDSVEVAPLLGELVAEPKPEPTLDDLLRGAMGNGIYEPLTPELVAAYRKNQSEATRQLKQDQRELFLEKNREVLGAAAELRRKAIAIGDAIANKIIQGSEVSQVEAQLWKKALDEARRAEERELGKAVAKTETHQSGGFLGLILNRSEKSE